MRRADRRRRVHRESGSRTSARGPGSGPSTTPWSTRTIVGVPRRPRQGLGLLREAVRDPAGPSRTRRIARSPRSSGAGSSQAVVTQNIDRLHELAGSRDVVEVHGSIRTSSCLDCGEVVPLDACSSCSPGARLPGCGRDPQAGRRDVRRAAPGGRRSSARSSWPAEPRCCSSSARRWRCIPSPRCRRRRSTRAGASRSSIAGSTPYDGAAAVRIDGNAGEILRGAAETLRGEQPQQP